jgi:glycosyltransferase involved in cell wall biosynthesis
MDNSYSVIIPALNCDRTLYNVIRSVLLQTLPAKEIIVVDNNSSDRTAEIACGFSTVRYVHYPKRNRSLVRNTGALYATGSHFIFLDSDVVLEADWIEKMDRYIIDRSVDVATSKLVPDDSNDFIKNYRFLYHEMRSRGTLLSMSKFDQILPIIDSAACVVSRKCFEENGGFNPITLRHEDVDFSIRCFLSGFTLGCSDQTLARGRSTRSEVSTLLRAFDVNFNHIYPRSPGLSQGHIKLLIEFIKQRNIKCIIFSSLMVFFSITGSLAANLSPSRRIMRKKVLRLWQFELLSGQFLKHLGPRRRLDFNRKLIQLNVFNFQLEQIHEQF